MLTWAASSCVRQAGPGEEVRIQHQHNTQNLMCPQSRWYGAGGGRGPYTRCPGLLPASPLWLALTHHQGMLKPHQCQVPLLMFKYMMLFLYILILVKLNYSKHVHTVICYFIVFVIPTPVYPCTVSQCNVCKKGENPT